MSIFLMASCKKEGCTNPNSENYDSSAKSDDGSCIYPNEKFVGTYVVNENYASSACGSGSSSYAITITGGSTYNQVVISNFADGLNVTGTVAGTSLTIPTQIGIYSQSTQTTWDVSDLGSSTGSISSNTLTFNYVIDDIAWDNDCGQVNANCVATK